MNDLIFAGLKLEKENQISTPFKKWIRAELIFHFFHFFSHIFPHGLNGGKKYLPIRAKEICSFSRG